MLVYSIVYPSTHWIVYLICGLYISRKKSRCFFVIFSCKCPFYCSLQAVSTEGDIDLTNHCCFKSTFAGPNIQSSVSFQGKCSYKRGRGWICNEFHVLQQTVVCLKEKKKKKRTGYLEGVAMTNNTNESVIYRNWSSIEEMHSDFQCKTELSLETWKKNNRILASRKAFGWPL